MFFKNKTVNNIKVNITGVRLDSKLLIIVTNEMKYEFFEQLVLSLTRCRARFNHFSYYLELWS